MIYSADYISGYSWQNVTYSPPAGKIDDRFFFPVSIWSGQRPRPISPAHSGWRTP